MAREVQDWEAFRKAGLLWLLNKVALHPRGFALAFHYPEDADPEAVKRHEVQPIGWSIKGDGYEVWSMKDDDAQFEALEATLATYRVTPE